MDELPAPIRALLAKPCPHCDRFAPTRQRLVFEFGEYAFDYLCAHCGERRARYWPA